MQRLESLISELLALSTVHRLLETQPDESHIEKFRQYVDLCHELGVVPDPLIVAAYTDFQDLYPRDER